MYFLTSWFYFYFVWHLSYVFFTLQVAFKTGDYKQQVIFIGGLTDGFIATEYVLYHLLWSTNINISEQYVASLPLVFLFNINDK